MGILEQLARLDRAAEAKTGGPRKDVPGHLLALCIGFVLILLGIGALLSGEREPFNLLLGMGLGTNFGAGVVAIMTRRARRVSGRDARTGLIGSPAE